MSSSLVILLPAHNYWWAATVNVSFHLLYFSTQGCPCSFVTRFNLFIVVLDLRKHCHHNFPYFLKHGFSGSLNILTIAILSLCLLSWHHSSLKGSFPCLFFFLCGIHFSVFLNVSSMLLKNVHGRLYSTFRLLVCCWGFLLSFMYFLVMWLDYLGEIYFPCNI